MTEPDVDILGSKGGGEESSVLITASSAVWRVLSLRDTKLATDNPGFPRKGKDPWAPNEEMTGGEGLDRVEGTDLIRWAFPVTRSFLWVCRIIEDRQLPGQLEMDSTLVVEYKTRVVRFNRTKRFSYRKVVENSSQIVKEVDISVSWSRSYASTSKMKNQKQFRKRKYVLDNRRLTFSEEYGQKFQREWRSSHGRETWYKSRANGARS